MPGKAWQPLIAVLVALGIPAAAAAQWRHLIARHPAVALALAAGWVVVCGVVVLAGRALAGPARWRLEQAGNAADRAAGWWLSGYGRRYRRWVLDSRRYVDVKDLATGGDHTPELDDVYVDVALVRRAPHQVPGNPLGSIAEDAAGRHSVSEFLDRRERVVLAVSGPPGSGKSTLLAHAARRSARAGRRNRRRLPVLLALREHAETIAADPRMHLPDVLRSAVSGVPGSEPDGWWERQLRRGRCMILLDGLDEVARQEDRGAVATWAERQITSYPGNHFMITSRPHGFPGPVIAQADILAVLPFTAGQVQVFVNRWYLAAERHATGAVSEAQMRAVRIRASESAAGLLKLLRDNPALYDLTVNPLLLTMIATVHRYRGALPGSRADLYGEICQVMLSRRIQAKNLPELLPWPAKHKLLADLAYQMMIKRASELPASEVLGILDPLLGRLPQSVTGPAFLDDVSRNGLLVEPAPGRYAFTHLTFQEYLAARHIGASPSLARTLVRAVDDPWWRETTLLYAAAADADQIVRACLDSATIPALTLAFDCAETTSELAPELRQRLDQARARAYEQDCDPQHRRLIAAVLASRLARQTVTTSAGARICDRPVPADLYWLFLQDSQAPQPDGPCEPGSDRPATGIWGSEAMAFVNWLNTITAGSMQAKFRLPREDELGDQPVASALAQHLPDSVTSAWTQPHQADATPGLWVRPGQSHPHLVVGDTIRQAIVLDASNTEILIQILTAVAFSYAPDRVLAHDSDLGRDLVLAVALALDSNRGHDRVLVLALVLALARVLAHVRALAHDLAHNLHIDPARARDLTRDLHLYLALARDFTLALALAVDLARALDPASDLDLVPASDLVRDRVIARTIVIARALACDPALDLDLGHALDLAHAVERGRDRDRDLARDLGLALESDRVLARALARIVDRDLGLDLGLGPASDLAHALARDPARAIDPASALVRDLARDPALHIERDSTVRLIGVPEIPLTWISDGPLGRAAQNAVVASTSFREACQAFADELTARAGIEGTTQIRASLDGSLTGALRDIGSPGSSRDHVGPGWDPVAGADSLADASAPLLSGYLHSGGPEAAGIRAVTLALASDTASRGGNAAEVFLAAAATVTLLQQREQGEARIGESLILALA